MRSQTFIFLSGAILIATLTAILALSAAPARANLPNPPVSDAPGDFYARLRANDAPVGGRLTIYAYFLDSLDVSVPRPTTDGRWLYLLFRDASNKNTFVVPGDLSLEDPRGRHYFLGFHPLGETPLDGDLHPGETRTALWWVAREADVADEDLFTWETPHDLTLWYGSHKKSFLPLDADDHVKVVKRVPWTELTTVEPDPLRPVSRVDWTPNPTAFDEQPRVKQFKQPEYPMEARQYNLTGAVQVVAMVDSTGTVGRVFVARSNAAHLLNVSALAGVKAWTFYPGEKNGKDVSGEIVVPISFADGKNQ